MTARIGSPSQSEFSGVTSMREIALFVEDDAHQKVIGVLARRLAVDHGISLKLNWLNAAGGRGRAIQGLRAYVRDLARHESPMPDLIIAATDANCSGLNQRIREINEVAESNSLLPPVIPAVPDPHIERWLLLDGAAFSRVLGRGCDAPEQKCSRDLYKQRLTDAVLATGTEPTLGGIEFAEDIVQEMDIERVKRADNSLKVFIDSLDAQFRQWRL